ncbi:2'-5' RNA ligase family protein [Clostridium estertheticum]|uniref:2'-5' RNA ligase family protein n=1 Tax=Clostridium estertheticum TaxID=238834 RepID=UPI0013E9318F|nr:2'-5' RNA ligase family protein [Clostridium estertheticum]MBZ9688958.1 2'-5' RNA ligase family protein [Clostridium estertheticum]
MYVYALVGYLDYETEEYFKNLWKDLSENNITQYGVDKKGMRPHITIADYDKLDVDKFVGVLNEFYKNKSKINIDLNILGTFINTGTLFLAPTLSTQLLQFHRSHHDHFKAFNEDEKSFYLPGMWNPHCTIASRLSEDNMVQAFMYCKSNPNKIYGKLNEIALIEIKLNDKSIAIEDRIVFSKNLN